MEYLRISKIINQHYPDFQIHSLVSLGEGFDSEAYLINEEVVFKFPRHELAAKNLYKEVAVLQEIAEYLPIHTPELLFIGNSAQANQLEFAGFEKINGKQMTSTMIAELKEKDRDILAGQLADFFKILHGFTLRESIADLEIMKKNKCRQEYQVIQETALPVLSPNIQKKVKTVYQKILSCDFEYTKCLVHNDFGANNLFYDEETDQLTGMIDFGDIAIYDRDIDFVCLLQDEEDGLDQAFTQKVLKYYQYGNLDVLNKKREFNHFYGQFENIYLGKALRMDDLLEESLAELQKEIQGYEENILNHENYQYYI